MGSFERMSVGTRSARFALTVRRRDATRACIAFLLGAIPSVTHGKPGDAVFCYVGRSVCDSSATMHYVSAIARRYWPPLSPSADHEQARQSMEAVVTAREPG